MRPTECPERHLHVSGVYRLSPLLLANGHMLIRCPCGRWIAKKIERERN